MIDHASGKDRAHLLARRGDLLLALADPAAVPAYRAALSLTTGTEHRLVRARLARAATFQGDLDTADLGAGRARARGRRRRRAAAAGAGQPAPTSAGDIDGAYAAADAARTVLQPDDPWQMRRPGQPAGPHRAPARRVVRAVPARAAPHPGRPGHGDRGVRRAPVRGGVPALRPGPLPRGDHPRRAAAAPGRAPRGAARGGVRDLPDRRGRPADGRPRPRRARADRGRRAARRRGRPGRRRRTRCSAWPRCTSPAATARVLGSCSRRRCRWPAGR